MIRRYASVILLLIVPLCAANGCGPGTKAGGYMPREAPPPPSYPRVRAVALDASLQASARQEIDSALRSSDPAVRVHAIEAVRLVGAHNHDKDIVAALHDREPIVRFAAALAAGELTIASAHQPLNELVEDHDPNVRVAVRFALHRLGDTRYTHDLESTVQDSEPSVRGNTAMVLGMLGDRTALKLLEPLRKDPVFGVRQQADEAMWRLGSELGRNDLIGLSVSKYPDDRMVGLIGLAAPRDERVGKHVYGSLTTDWPEVNLVAARALGMLGSDEGLGVALAGARSNDPRQRQLAAFALGAIGRADSQDVLRPMLNDENPDVKLAAAMAILQLKPAA